MNRFDKNSQYPHNGSVSIVISSYLCPIHSQAGFSYYSAKIQKITLKCDILHKSHIRQKCNAVLRTRDSRLVTGCSKTVIPESTKTIGEYAFYGTEINITGIPQNIDSILECAFTECKRIEIISLPDSLSYIGPGTFDGCSNLQSILIPQKVNKIYYYTFRNCTSLKNVSFKEGLKVIGAYSFEGCKLIDSIEIPATVYYLGSHSFTGCSSLKEVKLLCTEASLFSDSFDNYNNIRIGSNHLFK